MYLGACALVVRVGWKWLPACLEPCALLVGVSLCTLVVRALVVGAGWKWLPACLGACALVVGVLGGVSLCTLVVRALVVGVSLVRFCYIFSGRKTNIIYNLLIY